MSFGFSAGDFITIIELANKIRKVFVEAPAQFKAICEEVRNLSFTVQDIEIDLCGKDVTSQQNAELQRIAANCREILNEIEKVLDKYSELEPGSSNPNPKLSNRVKRYWKRLKWEPDDINDLRNRLRRNISLLNAFNGRITRNNVAKLVQSRNDEEDRMILDWLSPVNYAIQQNNFAGRRQAETGQWFLESSEFRTWIGNSNQTLFCPGIPGAGKTIIVSIVIDELYMQYRSETDIGIAYIYFNFRDHHANDIKYLLANLLKQLARGRPSVPKSVRDLYHQHHMQGTLPSLDEIFKNLNTVISEFTKVFIVVDALDECENANRLCDVFLSKIFDLQDQHCLNFLATSRYIPEIEDRFDGSPLLKIEANSEDVQRYLRASLGRLPRFVSRSTELQEEIMAEITKSIGGMFLLAQLHLESLIGKKSPKALRVALTSFSSGSNSYDSAYNNAMERVQWQIKDRKEMAIQVLSWTIFVRRQLTALELQHALAVEIDSPCLDKENLPEIDDMVSVCAGLVTFDEQSEIIRLIHYTAQDYLLRTADVWFPDAQTDISRTCITYLSFEIFDDGPSLSLEDLKDRLSSNIFYDYSTRNWGYHTRMSSIEGENWVLDFAESRQKVAACCQAMLYSEHRRFGESHMSSMHLAAYFGLEKLMLVLLERQHDPNLQDSRGWTPLEQAAIGNHKTIVNLLLHGNASHSSGATQAFIKAAGMGNESLVKFFLDKKISPDVKNDLGESPLLLAASNGQNVIVEMLLSRGADIECKDNNDQTPLLVAATRGHETTARLLLDRGANIESKHSNGRTPLLAAVVGRCEAVVKLLLDRGANLESKDYYGISTLSWAYASKYENIMSLLLEKGAVFESELPSISYDRAMAPCEQSTE